MFCRFICLFKKINTIKSDKKRYEICLIQALKAKQLKRIKNLSAAFNKKKVLLQSDFSC